jgi:hypothetical protein
MLITTDPAKLIDALCWSLAHSSPELRFKFRLQDILRFTQSIEPLDWGLTGDQLMYAKRSYLAVRRPQLTWRVIGYAESLGLQIEQLETVTDAPGRA